MRLYAALFVLVAVTLVLGVAVGTTDLPISAVIDGLLGTGDTVQMAVVRQVRLPRALLGLGVGAALAVAGVVMQALFRNPLASPDVVGTAAGASTGAILVIATGLGATMAPALPLGAIAGAALVLWLVVRLSAATGRIDTTTLLLTGVAVTSFVGALNSAMLAWTLPNFDVSRSITVWMLGGLTDRGWLHVALLAPCLVLGLAIVLARRRELDLLTLGEEGASALGLDTPATRRLLLLGAALLTGGAVAVGGLIGFVGLIVPHALRLIVGPAHGRLVPLAALGGAVFLGLMDIAARAALRPVELHLGVVTALIGAPVFGWLLVRRSPQ